MKLNKPQIRTLPKDVSLKILGYQKQYRTRFCEYEQHEPGWELHLAEGVTYSAFDKNGAPMQTIQMQAGHSLNAGGGWQSHQIGARIPIPEGHWVVMFRLFCGTPIIRVHHVGPYQIRE